jgi:hypothetical protein
VARPPGSGPTFYTARIDPKGFQNFFSRWVQEFSESIKGKTVAINLLKREKSLKGGLQTKRLKAAWDHDYLLKILGS